MPHRLAALLSAGLVLAVSAPAGAEGLLTQRDLSLDMARTIAETALDTCRKAGFHVSVAVLDRAGEARVWLRDDNARPHTFENSRRKAYTARTFGTPSAEFAAAATSNPARAAQATLPGVIALAGGLPIKAGEEIVGGVGVSGSPGGDKDEACAKAGIDKIADQLK